MHNWGDNMDVKIYTLPTCGICQVMKKKMAGKNIKYTELNFEDYQNILNTNRAPVLQIEDNFLYSPTEINNWINAQ